MKISIKHLTWLIFIILYLYGNILWYNDLTFTKSNNIINIIFMSITFLCNIVVIVFIFCIICTIVQDNWNKGIYINFKKFKF